MVIFFLSKHNSCRSQIAEALLRNCDKSLEIHSAGIEPVDHISDIAIEVMKEIGITIEQQAPKHYSEFTNLEADYLITVSEGTLEEFEIPPIKYKKKMHLTIHDPYHKFREIKIIKDRCREIRDEIKIEMEYFHSRILKK